MLACADPQWVVVRWPTEQPGMPEQPHASFAQAGPLELRVDRMVYEPEAIELSLLAHNHGEQVVEIEGAAIFLSWDGLEYAPVEAGDPLVLAPDQRHELVLRYRLGRTFTGVAGKLVLRRVRLGEQAIVELPELGLPSMPVIRPR